MNYLITVGMGIAGLIFLFMTIHSLVDLRMIAKGDQKYTILHNCTLYEDVLKKIVKDISFLRMKNNGNNLCSDMVEIEYIPYKFENLFM
jgi:hypothetical protein